MKRMQKRIGRQASFEVLEQRALLSADTISIRRDGVQLNNSISSEIVAGYAAMPSGLLNSSFDAPQLCLTTATDPANYVTSTGTPLDGVVELLMTFPTSTARGSATLLSNGRQLLTVAHNFFDTSGNLATSVSAVFHLAGGNQSIAGTFVDVGTGYNGNSLMGNDIAVLTLAQFAPIETPRFDIYRGSSELSQVVTMSGYGRSGTGLTGSTLVSGTKRNGSNRIDAFGESLNGTVYASGTVAAGKLLLFDFDDGTTAHDASGFFFGASNVGLGTAEVCLAPGDSGGPLLVDGKIAGVNDFVLGFTGFTDALPGTNSSFGEFSADTRVSAWASWIDSVADIIAPTVPASLDLAATSDSGISTTDNITNDTTPTFNWSASSDGTGSGIAGYWWAVDDSTPQTGGTFTTSLSATPTVTGNSGHTMYVVAVDVAGNFSSTVANLPFTIDTIGPRVNNVFVKGSGWTRAPYSYASIVPTGKQLAPIYTEGVNSIQLAFNESVTLTQSALVLVGTGARHGNTTATVPIAGFDPGTLVWTFSPLAADKYRIDLAATGATDAAGNLLDGEWANLKGSDIDVFTDDPSGRTLLSGDATAGGAFQFLFSYLPGDYNQNGLVEPTDLNTVADGNGDGVVNTSDGAAFLTPRYGNVLSLRREGGDYSNDEYVNLADYALWRATYGSTVNLAADGNGNGTVDAADYTLFRYWEYTQSAWYQGLSGFGAMLPVVDFGNAPNVANVTISGSASAHAPYSFTTHVGSGEQLQTVPVGAADTISITFSEDVNVTAENLRVSGLRTAYTPTLAQFSYDMASMTATWRFSGLPPIDHYIISLSDAVTDIEGNRLDGEWINPMSITTVNPLVSDFPSGNGNAGGNFNFVFTLLTGDANLDLQVTYADYSIWSAHYYQNGGFTIGDFDGSGQVNSADIVAWYSNYGKDLRNVQMLSDLNGDYTVNDADLNILATNLGMSNPTHNDGDLNGDGQINTSDLDLMFAQYGVQLSLAS